MWRVWHKKFSMNIISERNPVKTNINPYLRHLPHVTMTLPASLALLYGEFTDRQWIPLIDHKKSQ